jgi:nicotinamide mononucleotide (NMN) deamidase PncC
MNILAKRGSTYALSITGVAGRDSRTEKVAAGTSGCRTRQARTWPTGNFWEADSGCGRS